MIESTESMPEGGFVLFSFVWNSIVHHLQNTNLAWNVGEGVVDDLPILGGVQGVMYILTDVC